MLVTELLCTTKTLVWEFGWISTLLVCYKMYKLISLCNALYNVVFIMRYFCLSHRIIWANFNMRYTHYLQFKHCLFNLNAPFYLCLNDNKSSKIVITWIARHKIWIETKRTNSLNETRIYLLCVKKYCSRKWCKQVT